MHHLRHKKILIGITASIAAYKTILLVRLLIKSGAEVRVIMTPSSREFVSPLVLSTLTRHEVLIELASHELWANHVMLGRWADLFVIAPLSCNTLSKMVSGQCDNLFMAVYLSATCPVLVSPAMDEDMWKHPATQRNLLQAIEDGVKVLPVGYGELGSGLTGEGRMAEPEEILQAITRILAYKHNPLAGLKAVVTAGPTYEPIDPVRFIGNRSSGLMGISVANELFLAGADVQLVLGPSVLKPLNGIETIRVQTANDMFDATVPLFEKADIGVFSAAVADFRPAEVYSQKWKKDNGGVFPGISFKENPDILKHCGLNKRKDQTVVGFALETENEESNALKKLESKNASMIILNSLNDAGAGFGEETNIISIFDDKGGQAKFSLQLKSELAVHIVEAIINYRTK
jgi:phosphopantothenoylcysteine decarboxylase/phosphopantothenate--cysteine ligase